MNNLYIIIITIITLLLANLFNIIFKAINKTKIVEKFKENTTNKKDHLELAYKLCQASPEKSCQNYIYHYENLQKIYRKLKNNYCKKYPSHCTELGL